MLVELTVAEYEHAQASPTHFLSVSGHELPEIERIFERKRAYVVVEEKVGEAAKVADEADP
jgi:hypothetical protein